MLKRPISMDKKPIVKTKRPFSSKSGWIILSLVCALMLKRDSTLTQNRIDLSSKDA